VEASAAEVTRWEKVHSAYRYHLATVSLIVHLWRLVDSTRQTSAAMKCQLHAETRALEALIETNGLPVKKKAWTRSVSSLLACRPWWTFGGWRGLEGWQDLQQVAPTPRRTRWIEELLLSLMYWQEQRSRTRCPRRKAKLLQALEAL
jgi:hypothetical protein